MVDFKRETCILRIVNDLLNDLYVRFDDKLFFNNCDDLKQEWRSIVRKHLKELDKR